MPCCTSTRLVRWSRSSAGRWSTRPKLRKRIHRRCDMVIRDLPASEWRTFLESFTMQHGRWLVTIESIHGSDRVIAAQNEALEGIIARPREIVITVGGSTADHQRFEL